MLAHLRTEAYPVYRVPQFAPAFAAPDRGTPLTYEHNCERIEGGKARISPPAPDDRTMMREPGAPTKGDIA
jgi:hypothetical protein